MAHEMIEANLLKMIYSVLQYSILATETGNSARDQVIQRRLEGPLQKQLTLPPRNAQHLLRQRQETESNPNDHQSHSYKEIHTDTRHMTSII